VAKSNRCPSTKTLPTASPSPPATGELWQPAHELASGPEILFIFRGKTSGDDKSVSVAPVPFVFGRPNPSWIVQFALKMA